jgi:hypothetical protein
MFQIFSVIIETIKTVVAALDPPIGPGIQKTRPSVIELHRHDRRAALQRRGEDPA